MLVKTARPPLTLGALLRRRRQPRRRVAVVPHALIVARTIAEFGKRCVCGAGPGAATMIACYSTVQYEIQALRLFASVQQGVVLYSAVLFRTVFLPASASGFQLQQQVGPQLQLQYSYSYSTRAQGLRLAHVVGLVDLECSVHDSKHSAVLTLARWR